MKRDMDLVRDMLSTIEKGSSWFSAPENIKIEGWEAGEIRYHLAIMADAGLVMREVTTVIKGNGLTAVRVGDRPGNYRMTWAGHDFLESVRDPEVWKRTKDGVSKMGGWTFGLLKDMATAYAKHLAKERLGLDL